MTKIIASNNKVLLHNGNALNYPNGGAQYIPRRVVSGKLELPTGAYVLPSDVTDLNHSAMLYSFEFSSITSANLSSLAMISGNSALNYTFAYCRTLISVDLSSLVVINGDYALNYTFQGCSSLTSVDLSSLTTINGHMALDNCFANCSSLESMTFDSLNLISNNVGMINAFKSSSIKTLSFPALNSNSFGSYTSQFRNMLSGVTGCTVHFPSNLQSVIGSWSDVTGGFGGVNTTVLFDLPATA